MSYGPNTTKSQTLISMLVGADLAFVRVNDGVDEAP